MQREDWLLLFLATPARSGEHPRSLEPLRIMKGIFLMSQRGGGELGGLYQFKPYDYGPFTSDIYTDLQVLGLRGLVAQETVAGRSWRMYRPTTDGIDRASQLTSQVAPGDAATIDDAYRFVTTRGFLQLLRDIYAEYPAYAINTVVQDAAPEAMTLILALTCKDAVVMAADSQATELQGGNLMAGVRHDVEKLRQLGPNMLWGASGSVGVIQNIEDELADWASANSGKLDDPARRIKPELVKVVAAVLKAAYANYIQVPGRQPNPPVTSVLFAGRTAGTRWILEIEENGGAEFKDGFAAIGSAYHYANVAAAMLKEYSASTRELIHGQLLALRILDTAVTAAAFGVGGALRLAVVGPAGSKVLPADEVAQARDLVDGWRQAEAETLQEFVPRPDSAMIPDAPSEAEEATQTAS